MGKGRAEAFSDGVLAVAITLLVLDLHTYPSGHGSLAHQLGENWPSFVAYVVSFLVIGVIWVNHHALFTLIERVDRVLLFENLILLMFVTTLPFTTSTLADYVHLGGADARWAVVLYGISTTGMAASFTAMAQRIIGHGLLTQPVSVAAGRQALRRFGFGVIAYPLTTLIALAWPPLQLITIGLLASYYMFEQSLVLPVDAESEDLDPA
jgi:uncharacterized membrane protein